MCSSVSALINHLRQKHCHFVDILHHLQTKMKCRKRLIICRINLRFDFGRGHTLTKVSRFKGMSPAINIDGFCDRASITTIERCIRTGSKYQLLL